MEDTEEFSAYSNFFDLSPQPLNDDEDEDGADDVQYGCGFLAFRGHPNSLAMQQRLLKVNEEWNAAHSDEVCTRERTRKVKFSPKHELIQLQDSFVDLDEDEMDIISNSPQEDESDEGCKNTCVVAEEARKSNHEAIDMKAEIIRLVQELRAPLEVEEDNNGELNEFHVTSDSKLVKPVVTVSRPPLNTCLNVNVKSCDDHCASVIRAVFHMKSLTALQKLQQPDKIPLVRAQIHKRKLSPEILKDIFSVKFVKLMFEGNDDIDHTAAIKPLESGQSATLVQSDSSTFLSTNDDTPQSPTITNQFVSVEPEISVTEPAVPVLMPLTVEPSDKCQLRGCSASTDLRPYIVGGGDMSSKSLSSSADAKPKEYFLRSSIRPASSKFMSNSQSVKKKVEYASRSINDKNGVRRYPLIDADWLERRIKPQEISRHGSVQKKSVLYPVRSGSVPTISPVSKSQSELGSPPLTRVKKEAIPSIKIHQNDVLRSIGSGSKKPTSRNSFKRS